MQDKNDINGSLPGSVNTPDSDIAGDHKLSRQEAEEKVAEMFALAAAQRKDRKKKSASLPAEAQMLNGSTENLSEKPSDTEEAEPVSKALTCAELTERHFSPEEAEEEISKLFASEIAKHPRAKSKWNNMSGAGLEIAALEFISFFMFMFSMRKGTPGTFSLIAILFPVIIGIGYRLIWQHLSLREAVSRCKPHIFISSCFYFCVILSV